VKRALITGITGQDGRHLSEFLSSKGYQVFGLVRGQANPKIELVQDENPALELIEGDLRDLSSLIAVVEQVQPDEAQRCAEFLRQLDPEFSPGRE
jgi:GDPmannose 4,6-dehydratase